MDKLEKQCQAFGLKPSEARVFLAGLRQGTFGVQELSIQTGMKRPTIYHALGSLEQKGLIAKKSVGRRLAFIARPPERLRDMLDQQARELEEKQAALEALLPMLATPAHVSSKMQVQHLEGIEGEKTLVDEALYCQSRRWDILAPRKNFFSDMDPAYAKAYLAARQSREIMARTLWERPLPGQLERRLLTPLEIKARNPRYLPESFRGRFASTLILFDDKAVMLSSLAAKQGLLIQSPEVHDLLTLMFDGLWLASEPYEQVMRA